MLITKKTLLVFVTTSVSSTIDEPTANVKEDVLVAYTIHDSGSLASTRSLRPALETAKNMGECVPDSQSFSLYEQLGAT